MMLTYNLNLVATIGRKRGYIRNVVISITPTCPQEPIRSAATVSSRQLSSGSSIVSQDNNIRDDRRGVRCSGVLGSLFIHSYGPGQTPTRTFSGGTANGSVRLNHSTVGGDELSGNGVII